jgi:hypothetical protein
VGWSKDVILRDIVVRGAVNGIGLVFGGRRLCGTSLPSSIYKVTRDLRFCQVLYGYFFKKIGGAASDCVPSWF